MLLVNINSICWCLENLTTPELQKILKINFLRFFYTHQQQAWVSRKIFCEWYKEGCVLSVRKYLKQQNLPMKALLFLDNAPDHQHKELKALTQDGAIRVMPSNTTALLQPECH